MTSRTEGAGGRTGAGATRDRAWAAALVVAAAFAVHGRTIGEGYVAIDDYQYVRDNPHVQRGLAPDSIAYAFDVGRTSRISYFHPLTWLSLMLDTSLFGREPWGHHLVNVLLHAASALMLLLFLVRTTGSLGPSLAASLLFTVHPLTVEAVAWIAERKSVLSLALGMAAVLAYARHAERPSRARLALVASLACAGVLAKVTLVVLPALLLLLDWWPLGRVRGGPPAAFPRGGEPVAPGRLALEKALVAVPSLAAAVVSAVSLPNPTSAPMSLRIENAVVSVPRYVALVLWPARLSVFHPFPDRVSLAAVVAAALTGLTLTVLALAAARRWPFVAVSWVWFLVAIAPSLGLKQNGLWPAWADRFMYPPLVGLAVLAAFGGWAALQALPHARRVAAGAAAAAIVPLGFAAHAQGAYWEDSVRLFRRAIAIVATSVAMLLDLGGVLAEAGRTQEALEPLARAVRLLPSNARARAKYGLTLVYAQRFVEAGPELEAALRLDPLIPEALFGRAQLLASLGLKSEAAKAYREFLERVPDTGEVEGMRAEALRHVR